jgi:uracil-DNA glycosylase family 4
VNQFGPAAREEKSAALAALAREMTEDTQLPLTGQSNLVFGEGSPDCSVMFIGEAPGLNEDRERRPFVGRAGQLLRQVIRESGWKEADVYITNIVKRRPPENRDPLPEEITAYEPYLSRQIAIIAPKAIVALGRFSMNYFLPDAKISRDHGRAFRVGGRLVIPLFHPAAALRATNVLEAFRADFKSLVGVIARGGSGIETVPARAVEPREKQSKLF